MESEKRRRILMVDFDDEFLIQGQILLEDYGFDVTTTWSGTRACELLSSQKFDLVLLSDYLPDTGAHGLWSLLRKVPAGSEVAVIQSAYPTIPEIRDLLRDHVECCALPRGTPVQIVDRVVECLRQPRKARETTVSRPVFKIEGVSAAEES